jgi:hypothetical protein
VRKQKKKETKEGEKRNGNNKNAHYRSAANLMPDKK